MAYQPIAPPRFKVETVELQERIVLRPRRRVVFTLFLMAWLGGWTLGGIAAMVALHKSFSLFLVFWLCGWAIAWLYAVLQIGWSLTGSETISTQSSDLGITYRIFGYTISRLFRGRDIRDLAPNTTMSLNRYYNSNLPFFSWNKSGSIKFSYGARTVYAGGDLDEAEGRLIVARLARRLPKTAVSRDPEALARGS